MRSIGLDVHRDFCEVAIAERKEVHSAGRIETTPESLQLFAESLAERDQVALEATGNALAIAAILKPHVDRVVLANPAAVRGETNAGRPTSSTPARWRGCWPPAICPRSGPQTTRQRRFATSSRAGASSSSSAPARRTRSTRSFIAT